MSTTRTDTVREVFTFDLTPQEILTKADEASELNKVIADKEHKFSVLKKERKAEIDSLKGDLNHVLGTILTKKEDREVECRKIYDFERKIVTYVFRGEVLKERSMDTYEAQLQFDTKTFEPAVVPTTVTNITKQSETAV